MFLSFTGYMLFRYTIISEYEKNTQILFYKIQTQTSALLSNLMYEYSIEKNLLLQAHKKVTKYLEKKGENPLFVDLKEIHSLINNKDKLYNIYITDKDLVIRNSTFVKDIGFDISFAKAVFDEHFEQNITGICTPLFEKSSKQFLSYTDAYLVTNKALRKGKVGVLQVSYTYKKSTKRLIEIQKIISHYPSIVDAKAYIMVDSGFVNDIILKDFASYKPDLTEIIARMEDGSKINEKLLSDPLVINSFTKENISYTEMNIATQSPIFENTKIIYSIVLDNSSLKTNLKMLNTFMFFVLVLGVVAIFITHKLRKKEIKLSEQDKFVQSSMHEIKTPLSIITLNNELRELEFGRDEYSIEIDSAIKTLKTSYEDMSFTITKGELSYPVEVLNLEDVVRERVAYFYSIATSYSKEIELDIKSRCSVKISKVELIRLIDNNLSNAIKYSASNSRIRVRLNAEELSFYNVGNPIKHIKGIFGKYVRENSVVGGHGLGLSIVKEISQRYGIDINLTSSSKNGTMFSYSFKCHTSDAYALSVHLRSVK